jgi:hypothetical protein
MPTATVPGGDARLRVEASRDKPLRLQAREADLYVASVDNPFDTAPGADNSGLITGCHPLHAGRRMVVKQNVEVVTTGSEPAKIAIDNVPGPSKKEKK